MFQAIASKKINSNVTSMHQLNELNDLFVYLSYQLYKKIFVWAQLENRLAKWPNILL